MIARGHGHLVGVSSENADCPTGRSAPYGASKAGLTFLLEAADIELRARGIAITIVHPGFTKTAATDEMQGQGGRPSMVPGERAAKIIDRAIQRRTRIVRFPWILDAIGRFAAWLPRFIMRPLIRGASH